ncbi:MAG TPA: pyruvate kinase [Pirellulaceae bacterium]|nr:pyruvate kinase [Pirellulaceae bacterium]
MSSRVASPVLPGLERSSGRAGFSSRSEDQVPESLASLGEIRKTKIVCTLGPACDSAEGIRQLLAAGATVFRFNFSHGTHASHSEALGRLRDESAAAGIPVAVMQDLCGPKIRISYVAVDDFQTVAGQRLRVTTQKRLDKVQCEVELASTYEPLLDDVRPGDTLLIDDGRVELRVLELCGDHLVAEVTREGTILRGKGLNMPGVALSTPSITEKDWKDLEWAIANGVEYVALSFVRKAEDLLQILQYLDDHGSTAKVVAKIERPEALANIHEIVRYADAVMVARGDLGLETDFAEVPLLQKRLIDLCRQYAKPVITATQMLDSMVHNPTPTRAETSDVANAVLDGSDAIMLSNETAAGRWPKRAVEVLDRIALASESGTASWGFAATHHERSEASALTEAAARLAIRTAARRIVVYTRSGNTARLMARYRLPIPIVAVTSVPTTCRQLALSYGVHPLLDPEIHNMTQLLAKMNELALTQHWGEAGDHVLVVSGLDGQDGHVDTLHVHVVRG